MHFPEISLRSILSWLAVFFASCTITTVSLAQMQVTVMDPQGAVVAGARVTVIDAASSRPLGTQTTGGDGVARFDLHGGQYTLEVLAPGFAAVRETAQMGDQPLVVKLKLAALPQSVVVSATATPIAEEQAGVPNVALGSEALTDMQATSAAEALRFLPGAIVNTAGQRGGQASLFVRGGESRYNRVLVDGVPVNDPGGYFDLGVVPLYQVDRIEMVRGPVSSLYGSDAMTSLVQFFSATGHARRPELTLGADGGNFSTAHGYGSLSAAARRFDYNLFGEQFNTGGQGLNDGYANTNEGANIGLGITPSLTFRVRARHSVNSSGVQGEWDFNGAKLLPPDRDQFARQNNFTGSAELAWSGAQWQHRVTGFEYSHDRRNVDQLSERGCDFANYIFIDCPFATQDKFNRAGLDYQGEFTPRSWARTSFGYFYQDEHGDTRDPIALQQQYAGRRHEHDLFAQELITYGRLAASAGFRYVRDDSFGHTTVPRLTAVWTLLRGANAFSGTRLRFATGAGIVAPDFLETFGSPAFYILPNLALKPERNRSIEAGVLQGFAGNRINLGATYYNNLFRDRIEYQSLGAPTYQARYVNLDRVLAHGAEVDLHARLTGKLGLQSGYWYTSTQVLRAPLDPTTVGQPLLRRPKHAGNFLLTYNTARWGGDVGATMVGRRPDSDFLGFNINHAAGYARVDAGAWYQFTHRATAYINLENALDKGYNEVVGYPGLGRNFRAGVRYRLGGD